MHIIVHDLLHEIGEHASEEESAEHSFPPHSRIEGKCDHGKPAGSEGIERVIALPCLGEPAVEDGVENPESSEPPRSAFHLRSEVQHRQLHLRPRAAVQTIVKAVRRVYVHEGAEAEAHYVARDAHKGSF